MNEQLKKLMIGTGVFLIAIWTIGPFIAVAGIAPLASVTVRVLLSLLVLLSWVGLAVVNWRQQHLTTSKIHRQPTTEPPPWLSRFSQQLNITKLRMQQSSQRRIWQQKAPWTLIIGPHNSGKSSLLKALRCQQITITDEAKETVPFQFWINKTEHFLVGDIDRLEQQQDKYSLWQHIIPLVIKQRLYHALHRVIIIMDFPQLCLTEKKQLLQISQQFCRQLAILQSLAPNCSIQLVINQCDRMIGFKEYFAECKTFSKEHTFGLSFRNQRGPTNFDALFHQQRKALIEKISQDTLPLAQKQHIQKNRKDISQLPFQLDLLLLRSKRFLNPLPDTIKKQITDISFCAAEQRHQPMNITTPYLRQIISPLHPRTTHANESHVTLFLDHNNFARQKKTQAKKYTFNTNLKSSILPVVTTIALSAGLSMLYYTGAKHGYALTKNTMEYVHGLKTQPSPRFIPQDLTWLSQLYYDQSILLAIKNSGALKYQWLGISTVSKLYHQVEQSYQSTLTAEFEPYAFSLLSNALLETHPKDATNLYSALKVYLMLTQHQHYDQQQITAWYRQQWQQSHYSPELTTLLTQQLTNFLAHYHTYWPANPELVTTARTTLNQLAPSDLAFLKLETQYLPTQISITTTTQSILDPNSLKISNFFTIDSHKRIMALTRSEILDILHKTDWVTSNQAIKLTEKEETSLTTDVQSHYQAAYQQAWQNLLNNLEFKTPQNLSQLNAIIIAIQDPQSDFYNMLSTIFNNTSQQQLEPSNTTDSSDPLHDTPIQQQPWEDTLQKIQATVQSLLKMQDSDRAAYAYTVQTINKKQQEPDLKTLSKQTANAQPMVQKGLNVVMQSYWPIMFQASHNYLNAQWRDNVSSIYTQTIENKFPIFYNAHDDIDTDDFNAFFGPEGAIDTFFNNYLAPFVNMDGYYWTWKKIDGQTLGIPQTTLDMIIRASIIQQMFYSNQTTKPSQQFALALKSMSDDISSVSLDIEGQTMTVKPGDSAIHKLATPGTKQKTTLSFYGSTGKYSLTTHGPWAWLRMTQLGTIKTTSDANQFFLSFKTTHYDVSFGLVAQSKVNPYLPGVLGAFRCPDSL